MKFHLDAAGIRYNFGGSQRACIVFVGVVGRSRALDCPGTAEIANPLCSVWIRALKSVHMCFFNTHKSVVWCLVNSCLTAKHTAVSFTHPLEMLKLEKKNLKGRKKKRTKEQMKGGRVRPDTSASGEPNPAAHSEERGWEWR